MVLYPPVGVSFIWPNEFEKCRNSVQFFELDFVDFTTVWDDPTFTGNVQNQDSLSGNLVSICGDSIPFIIDVVKFDCDNCRLYVPNAFTPNNDGINDEFHIGLSCLVESFSVEIFNRWGNIIFSSDDFGFSWHGRVGANENVPAGVYPYIIKYKTLNGKNHSETGFISVFK